MSNGKHLPARFFEAETGRVPVREWLLSLSPEDRKAIGDHIRTAEFAWPIGMPLCRAISGHKGLWEIRSNLPGGRIARVFFCAFEGSMVLCTASSRRRRRLRPARSRQQRSECEG